MKFRACREKASQPTAPLPLELATVAETERHMRYLGTSAKRALRRCRPLTMGYLDAVHEGWLAWNEAVSAGRSAEAAYLFAEGRMNTVCQADLRQAARTFHVEPGRGVRRITPGQWRDLAAFTGRVLQLESDRSVMLALFRGLSIEEVARDRGVALQTVRVIRARAVRKMLDALAP